MQKEAYASSSSDDQSSSEESVKDAAALATKKKSVKRKVNRSWVKKDLPKMASKMFNNEGYEESKVTAEFSPVFFFEQYFSDDFIMIMVEQSMLYAKQKGNLQFTVTAEEIKAFLAILILSGYVPLPRYRLFWDQGGDVHNEVVSGLMSRNRFAEIMRFLHFADNNNLDKADKYAKIRPLFNHLNTEFLETFRKEEQLSVDESMVPYYGRHGCKQFIRSKPIRFGYKLWCLNTNLGYLVTLKPYQGKGHSEHSELGLGASVVLDLIAELPPGPKYKLYFDNFFTSPKLIDELSAKGFGATGTVRANRTENCPLLAIDKVKKQKRGTYDYRYDNTGKFVMARWNDNSVVTMVSNVHGVNPITKAKRWSASAKEVIEIDQPSMIAQYNMQMGGTDRMDQNVGCYRISIRSKKWWWPLFIHMIDVSLQNAFYLYKRSPSYTDGDFLSFKREIVEVYSKVYGARKSQPTRAIKVYSKLIPDQIRTDGMNHIVQHVEKQRVCAECKKKANFICQKCNIALHPKACFADFHMP